MKHTITSAKDKTTYEFTTDRGVRSGPRTTFNVFVSTGESVHQLSTGGQFDGTPLTVTLNKGEGKKEFIKEVKKWYRQFRKNQQDEQ